jgi:peptidoglycan-N-acetylglucosamine deacetylase
LFKITFMNFYWVKTNWFIKWLFPKYVWDIQSDNCIYLTFDDGPTPEITEWVLDQLKKYNAKATFFCIGEKIQRHPEIFQKLIDENHSIGNHTFNHLNGWKTSDDLYLENVAKCEKELEVGSWKLKVTASNHNSNLKTRKLFRPPYGKLSPMQSRKLLKLGYEIIMWDVLSADFDTKISKEKCLQNVLENIQPGSVVVFHDSAKAFNNLEYVLPKVLEFAKSKNWKCEKI